MVQELCRVCAKVTTETIASRLFGRGDKYLLHKLKILTGVMIENSVGLPKLICCECKKKLEDAYDFRKGFLQAQKYLRQRVKLRFAALQILPENTSTRIKKDAIKEEIKCVLLQKNPSNETEVQIEVKNENVLEAEPKTQSAYAMEFISIETDDQIKKKNFNSDERVSDETCKLRRNDEEFKTNTETKTFRTCKKDRSSTKRAEKSYVCDQCGNHFNTRNHFVIHQRRHAGDKPYTCEICSKTFFTNSELTRHMRKHTGEKPFACSFCSRRFSDYSTRLKHERTHTNERPFLCIHCGKSFTTSYILKNHMLIHTGEKLFRCELCNRSFSRRTHLVVHNRSILHKQAEAKSGKKLINSD